MFHVVLVLLPLVVITCITVCWSANETLQSTNVYLTMADKSHLRKILEPGLTSNDAAFMYYAVHGYRFLGETLPNQQVRNTLSFATIIGFTNITICQKENGHR